MDEELAAQEGSQPLLISWVRHWGFLGKMMPFITGWDVFFPKTSENAIIHDLTTPRRQFNK
jgi:hypothetical protein